MSQEVFKLTIGGEVRWRGCNTNSGQLSLDDTSLEPLFTSLEPVVDRLLSNEQFSSGDERIQERARLIQGYSDIENYLNGQFVLDIDGFFRSVERVTQSDIAAQIGLNVGEVAFLTSSVEAIRQELAGDKRWHVAPSTLRGDLHEEVYLKLFPDFDDTRGVIAHPALMSDEVTHLDNGLRYFNLLAGSRELRDVDG